MRFIFPRFAIFASVAMVSSLGFSAQFKFPEQTLTVPDGFEVEQIAGPEQVHRPISASFDEQGRLYVTDSSGSNDKPDKQLEEKPHRIVRLESTKGDGKFDKSIVFADKMMFPEGCLWHDGSLYVSAPPSIWKLTDTNNDGVADVREEWHQGKTLTGCANDLHGPYLGPDGMIYWCKGAFQEQTYELPNGKPFVSRAAHIFRAWPDHSGLEPVLTGGMDNPVGVAFSAEDERFLCGTFFVVHEPGHRDGIIHAIYGGVYGKINNVTDDHKKTGELMPIMTHMGPAAPCSVIRYESKVFGTGYQNNLFVCSFNLHKVSRHILEPDGSTFKTRDSDFLTSDNPDFHPTDVIEDADGSLVVLNTGGWYKICCPTSQLSKPDVLGAVYRIRKVGAGQMEDPRGLAIAWGKTSPIEIANLLGDARPYVVRLAIAQLAVGGSNAVPSLADALRKPNSLEARRNAIWALTRINAPAARDAVRIGLNDKEETVRNAALHSISLWSDKKARKSLEQVLNASNPQLQRIAAEALGRIGNKESVPALLQLAAKEHDRVLEHSIAYALIQIDDPAGTARGLTNASTFAKRTALIALDQMENGGLKAETVAPLLGASDKLLQETASWIAGHHPDWGGALAGFFKERVAARNLSEAERENLVHQLSNFAGAAEIQEIMGAAITEPKSEPATRLMLLKAMAGASVKECPSTWVEGVRKALVDSNEEIVRQATLTAHALAQAKPNPPNFSELLLRIAHDENKSADLRLAALNAISGGGRSLDSALFTFLIANVDSAKPLPVRNAAVGVLTKAKLEAEQQTALMETLKTAGPLELSKLLTAFERRTNEATGLKLVAALKDAKSLASLRADLLKGLLAKYPATVQQQAQGILTTLNADAAKQGEHVDELLKELKEGDIRRGQAVFNSPKAACATCHTMGYLGGKVGPDLTTIGTVRTERDLLESIIYPSASFVRSFEPFIVSTKTEDVFVGIVKKDSPEEIVMATGPTTEARIARADIVDMRPGTVSIMPIGFEQQLSKQELADLVMFLKSTKWGPR